MRQPPKQSSIGPDPKFINSSHAAPQGFTAARDQDREPCTMVPHQKVVSDPVLYIPVTSPNTPHTSHHLSRQTGHRPQRPMEKAATRHLGNMGDGDTAALGHCRLGGAPQPRSRATLKTAACKRKDDSVTKTLGHRTTDPNEREKKLKSKEKATKQQQELQTSTAAAASATTTPEAQSPKPTPTIQARTGHPLTPRNHPKGNQWSPLWSRRLQQQGEQNKQARPPSDAVITDKTQDVSGTTKKQKETPQLQETTRNDKIS